MKILNERIEKTIVGLATAPFTQNLAIIRISGKNTYNIIEKIFKKNGKEELLNFFDKKNKVIYGSIISDSKVIDKVIITCFFSPNSFNGEDIVEITCHGNILIVNKIINLIIKKGGVVAEKGEFTKRAVINGKINISQANSINEIIKSSNQKEIDLALHNLNFKKKDSEIDKIEKELVIIIGNIEVNIDYPEYKNFSGIENGELENKLKNFEKVLKDLKNEGIKINESKKGIKVVILGKPNVGKSTFMNNFIKEEKSIVSPIAGTTRDIIENDILIDGIPFTFLDTAGIHDSNDEIEKIGINKALFSIKDSDIIIFILDKSSF
jgi:tRNA modification GTPase